jgi:hypothetical protein
MMTKQPESLSTAEIASAANRQPTNGEEIRKPQPPPSKPGPENAGPLLPENFQKECRTRWDNVQAGFVDEPRSAVQKADELVAETMQKLAESFAGERTKLEQQWDRGGNVSTEDLRVSLQKYRTFFNRLLAV